MRLSHIKLAGFKSFVDPTHVALPGQLVGIVGPNGCGKSNVIDALRWVLGESKASALRGESMQDVIFNGSGNRKPVARASVELVFDNSLGKAMGQWSSYAEIAIKRVLKRDGESSYYINNQHVRRKDITDIFLGTGLGARAYAIIEQGMISRIIEAKPEELRVFLEEAAGVSKYRDRRRETELRLGDTRENLLRVADILHELEKQLTHLAEQAEVAKQYRELQARYDTTQRLLWLLNKQEAAARRVRFAQNVEKTRNELEAETTRLREVESQLETTRTEHYALADALHGKQGELYAVNAEVSRLEQQLTFLGDQRSRLGQQIGNTERQIEVQRSQLQGTQGLLTHWQGEQQEAAIRMAERESQAEIELQQLPQYEELARTAQEQQGEVQREHMQLQQQQQLAQTQLGHVQRNLAQLDARKQRLQQELENLPQSDTGSLELAQQQLAGLTAEHASQEQLLNELQSRLPVADEARRKALALVQESERKLAQIEARLAALEQLQQQVDQDKNLKQWLGKYQLENVPRLWQSIRIEAGWEDALEAVLRERLNAVRLERLDEATGWQDAPPAKLAVYAADNSANHEDSPVSGLVPLAQYVNCQDQQAAPVVQDWLASVYAVSDIAQALDMRAGLPRGAWLVTPQGHMVGPHSILFHAPDSQIHGVLARQREIETLQLQAREFAGMLDTEKQQSQLAETAFREIENRISPLRATVNGLQQQQHGLQMQLLKLTQAQERNRERASQINYELEELAEHVAGEQGQQEEIAERIEILRENLDMHQAKVEATRQKSVEQDSILRQHRERVQKAQHDLQEARFFAKTCADKISDLDRNLQNGNVTLAQLEETLTHAREELAQLSDEEAQRSLQVMLQKKQLGEQALAEARNALEHATVSLNKLEQERLSCEQKLNPLRDKVNDLTLKEQEARLQFEQWDEQLRGVDEVELQPFLEGAKQSGLQNELNRISDDIKVLGAVNLAALEELQHAQERKIYLDAQAKDLSDAMATLEEAIHKIDRESRDLLLSTYEAVNRNLSEMFPILFGGGDARLVLTGEEILDSGVQVMAHPPGKKNASIHLLSGGEKALTAIALVFSLFQLNPAPFCLLDEVDAPLDDTNTERLCKLIAKMAQNTQFIFISHNKITMELAEQLVGVTMQERGVSKVVSVDIEEALKMNDKQAAAA